MTNMHMSMFDTIGMLACGHSVFDIVLIVGFTLLLNTRFAPPNPSQGEAQQFTCWSTRAGAAARDRATYFTGDFRHL